MTVTIYATNRDGSIARVEAATPPHVHADAALSAIGCPATSWYHACKGPDGQDYWFSSVFGPVSAASVPHGVLAEHALRPGNAFIAT